MTVIMQIQLLKQVTFTGEPQTHRNCSPHAGINCTEQWVMELRLNPIHCVTELDAHAYVCVCNESFCECLVAHADYPPPALTCIHSCGCRGNSREKRIEYRVQSILAIEFFMKSVSFPTVVKEMDYTVSPQSIFFIGC